MIVLISNQLNIVDSDDTACNIQNIIIDENTGELLNVESRFYYIWTEQINAAEPIKKKDFDPYGIWKHFIERSNKSYEDILEEQITEWEQSSDNEYVTFKYAEDASIAFTASISLHRYLFEKRMFKFVESFNFDTVIYKPEGNVRGAAITIAGKDYFFERR